MYAAAGGASLASRQARQRQRQQKRNQQIQAKLHPLKATAPTIVEHGVTTPTRHSRQFHQLPTNYLRTPQIQARKLSASYMAQSKLLLPIEEGDTQSVAHMRIQHSHAQVSSHYRIHHSHSHAHPHQQHQHHHQTHFGDGYNHGHVSPKLVQQHSGSVDTSFQIKSHLTKSATATLPLVSQMKATPPETPQGVDEVNILMGAATDFDRNAITAPANYDGIVITPATPMASPGHIAKLQSNQLTDEAAEKEPLTTPSVCNDEELSIKPTKSLPVRKCSVYRMRRSDALDKRDSSISSGAGSGVRRQLKDLHFNHQQQQRYEPLLNDEPQLIFKGLPHDRKLQMCAYCEEGICFCEHTECAQGRAAWLERGRRCSVQESQQQAACHRRWVKGNRIQDASLGGSSDDEDFLSVLRGPSTFANAFLYVGLGTIALGLVIAFVGTGEKGFKTVELRLIGPSLICLGLICCILRILFCICPSQCISSAKKTRSSNGSKFDIDHTTSLLHGEIKRVSIARSSGTQSKYPITHKRSNHKMLNEGMEALRQIATTSIFMQNEQKHSTNKVVPIINEPEKVTEPPSLEMIKLGTFSKVCDADDSEKQIRNEHCVTKISETNNMNDKCETNNHKSVDSEIFNSMTDNKTATNVESKTTDSIREPTGSEYVLEEMSSSSKVSRQRVALNQQIASSNSIKGTNNSIQTSFSGITPCVPINEVPITSSNNISDTTNVNTHAITQLPVTIAAKSRTLLSTKLSISQPSVSRVSPAQIHDLSSIQSAPLSLILEGKFHDTPAGSMSTTTNALCDQNDTNPTNAMRILSSGSVPVTLVPLDYKHLRFPEETVNTTSETSQSGSREVPHEIEDSTSTTNLNNTVLSVSTTAPVLNPALLQTSSLRSAATTSTSTAFISGSSSHSFGVTPTSTTTTLSPTRELLLSPSKLCQ